MNPSAAVDSAPPGVASGKPRRRWGTLSLRALMLLIVLLAGWLAWQTNRARAQRRAVEAILRSHGRVDFDDRVGDDGSVHEPPAPRPVWQEWVIRYVGDDYIRKPRLVLISGKGFDPSDSVPPRDAVAALARLPDVIIVGLVGGDVGDADLVHLRPLRDLRSLTLLNTPRITGAGLVHLRGKSRLWRLNLSRSGVGDAGLAHLVGLPALDHLALDRTAVTDAGMVHVGRMSGLERLGLDDTRVSDAGVAHLRGLKRLRVLSLNHTQVTDQTLRWVRELPALESLFLERTGVTPEGVAALPRDRPDLQIFAGSASVSTR